MKNLLVITLTLCAFAAFGEERPNRVNQILSILPEGIHYGLNCSAKVTVAEYPVRSAFINLSKDNHSIFKIVTEDSDATFREYKKEFIQIEFATIDDTRSSMLERTIRTVMVDNSKIYVVVEEAITVNRDRRSDAIECVVEI